MYQKKLRLWIFFTEFHITKSNLLILLSQGMFSVISTKSFFCQLENTWLTVTHSGKYMVNSYANYIFYTSICFLFHNLSGNTSKFHKFLSSFISWHHFPLKLSMIDKTWRCDKEGEIQPFFYLIFLLI